MTEKLSERVHLADVTDEVPQAYYTADSDDLIEEIRDLEAVVEAARPLIDELEGETFEYIRFGCLLTWGLSGQGFYIESRRL